MSTPSSLSQTDPPVPSDFPAPTHSFTDLAGRDITVRALGNGPVTDRDALVALYQDYPEEHRTLGIPPRRESRIHPWLDSLEEGDVVVAWHDDRAVGQAVLVPDDDGHHELAIFVHPEYHHARIGSHTIRTLLGYDRENGVETVWLVVEESNTVACNLYESVGFEVDDRHHGELEMVLEFSS